MGVRGGSRIVLIWWPDWRRHSKKGGTFGMKEMRITPITPLVSYSIPQTSESHQVRSSTWSIFSLKTCCIQSETCTLPSAGLSVHCLQIWTLHPKWLRVCSEIYANFIQGVVRKILFVNISIGIMNILK